MTTEREVPPLSAEEIASWAETIELHAPVWSGSDDERAAAVQFFTDLQNSKRVLAMIAANQRACICTDAALCAHHDRTFIRPLEEQIDALQSQLRDANRRASGLSDELGATQNAAQTERVELEAKLREAEWRLTAIAPYTQHLLGCATRWCTACDAATPCPYPAGSLIMTRLTGTGTHVGANPQCNCGLACEVRDGQ